MATDNDKSARHGVNEGTAKEEIKRQGRENIRQVAIHTPASGR